MEKLDVPGWEPILLPVDVDCSGFCTDLGGGLSTDKRLVGPRVGAYGEGLLME